MMSVNVAKSGVSDETNSPTRNDQPMDKIKGIDASNFIPCKVHLLKSKTCIQIKSNQDLFIVG